jgi:hypothetical protein
LESNGCCAEHIKESINIIATSKFVRSRRRKAQQRATEPKPPTPVQPLAVDKPKVVSRRENELADALKRNLVQRYNGMGDDARLSYFLELLDASINDNIHRTEFSHLAEQPEFSAMASGLRTWVEIGFETIAKRHDFLRTEHTMNLLYAALLKELQSEHLPLPGNASEFTYRWAERVREHRAHDF